MLILKAWQLNYCCCNIVYNRFETIALKLDFKFTFNNDIVNNDYLNETIL